MTQVRLSFEFFPPRSEAGQQKLLQVAQQLLQAKPEYFSVTFGAGGSTRDNTASTVKSLMAETGIKTAPHISGIGSSIEQIDSLLSYYQSQDIHQLVVLRGDIPSGLRDLGDFPYAIDLVRHIRSRYDNLFRIEVAAYPEMHPQALNYHSDLRHFVAKVEAGANSAITQYFYNADAYFSFVDKARALGVSVPIVPGIMPITNYRNLVRFSDNCGAEIPRWIRKQMEQLQDDPVGLQSFGEEVVSRLVEQLLAQGVTNLHFYSMNQAEPSLAICRNLGLIA